MSTKAISTPGSDASEQEPLAGTVKPYAHHLAVCTGGPPELWAARVEEMEGLFATLYSSLTARGLQKQVKLTACDTASHGEGLDILLLPEMLVLPEISAEKVDRLVAALAADFQGGLPFDVMPMAGGDHVFVCVHANRDARCGKWGPLFYEALAHEVTRQGAIAHVHRTSHIGGHRFAATCIVYPQGIWYGRLRPEDAGRFVEEVLLEERLLADHYRGRLGLNPAQQVAEAKAAFHGSRFMFSVSRFTKEESCNRQ
jgi:(2Fe-2S) ferredoxin